MAGGGLFLGAALRIHTHRPTLGDLGTNVTEGQHRAARRARRAADIAKAQLHPLKRDSTKLEIAHGDATPGPPTTGQGRSDCSLLGPLQAWPVKTNERNGRRWVARGKPSRREYLGRVVIRTTQELRRVGARAGWDGWMDVCGDASPSGTALLQACPESGSSRKAPN